MSDDIAIAVSAQITKAVKELNDLLLQARLLSGVEVHLSIVEHHRYADMVDCPVKEISIRLFREI